MKLFHKVIRRIARSIPGIRATNFLRAQFDRTNPYFVGWGMTTGNYPPWHQGEGDSVSRAFYEANEQFLARVREGSFQLTQLRNLTVEAREEFVRGLSWRHFIAQWSVLWAARGIRCLDVTLVECGVCDGMLSYFAMKALQGQYTFNCTLYDAWQAMQAEQLLTSEIKAVGAYGYLSLDTTKSNLEMFREQCTFVKGTIPESLSATKGPDEVNWLHVDLNSAIPTLATLEYFWPVMPSGSVVLIDDYLWSSETKHECDSFFADRNCVFLPLPTGQGVCFKN